MGKKRKLWRITAAITFIIVMTVMPAYAESEPALEDFIDKTDSIRDYDGVVTDEMIEEWEQESPTDLYGNELEWDRHGSGNEDGAGDESSADMMEAPTYDAKEQKEVLENIPETPEMSGTGWLYIKGNLEDDWPGYNIAVVLYDKNHRRVEVSVYSQNGFEAKEEVTEGIYKVYRAYVPGDENGRLYPLVVSDNRIEVEKGKITELTVRRAVAINMGEETKKSEHQEEPKAEPSTASPGIRAAAGIGMGILLLLAFGIAVYKKNTNYHRYQ